MKRLAFALVFLANAACTTVGHEKVEGWPELEVIEHYVSSEQMLDRCRKYVGFGMVPLACAEFHLAENRCHIWYNEAFAPRAIVEHERLHCRGYDHVGETTMREFLARHRAALGEGKTASAAHAAN